MPQNFDRSPEHGKENPLLAMMSERMFQFSYASRVIAETMFDAKTLQEAEATIAGFNQQPETAAAAEPETMPAAQETPELNPEAAAAAAAAVIELVDTDGDMSPAPYLDEAPSEEPPMWGGIEDDELAA